MEVNIPVIVCAVLFGVLFVYLCRKPMQQGKNAVAQSIEAADQNTKAIIENTAIVREHTEILRQYLALRVSETK